MSLHLALALTIACSFSGFSSSTDTISTTQFIKDPETVVSRGGGFKFGFFSPMNTTKRYVGVLYNLPITTSVWVANKEFPLNDTFGKVTISDDGNLVVLDGQETIIWSTNLSNSKIESIAQILDSGNLVLRDNSSGAILWESFKNPCDSYLPNMRLSRKTQLISWKNPLDPSGGSFSVGLGPLYIPEFFLWNGGQPLWRSGPWDGQTFTGIPDMYSEYNNGFRLANDNEGNTSLTYNFANDAIISYIALDYNGNLMQKHWNGGKQDWEVMWSSQENECNFYGKCGPFGICNIQDTPICSCLRGFEPKYMDEWSRGNWTSGCVRREGLQCVQNSSVGEKGKEDGFLKLSTIKVPDSGLWLGLADRCSSNCLNNCSCVAYSYVTGIGCMHWTGSLIDLEKFPSSGGADFFIRVAYSELDKKRDDKTIVVAITVSIGSITVAIATYICWKRMTKRKGKDQESKVLLSRSDSISQVKFEFENLASATGHFQSANKLGEGGFGSVYKGKMKDGQEIAVKRLSRSSGQGVEEFMNEVTVISKLQHRNLVKLLGCCVEREEKMLVYEYMPNRSLDALIFDPLRREFLPWSKCKNIIEGIGRGLLYLHRDSRLKIIHRDLKASNILLDEDLNPKISDFGMARIFGGNKDQEKTKRVVGTYGYMSPEYAMKGTYSEKSDVYSFGVILLEIISGKKSTHLYTKDQKTLSLLGLTWKLWKDDKIVDLIDPWMSEPCFRAEILRYIHVGLLCVQESAKDRPTVSNLLWMFGTSESEDLPKPKQPAFTERETSSQDTQKIYSANNVTITILEGR